MQGVTKARRNNREVITSPIYNDDGEIIGYGSALSAMRMDKPAVKEAEPASEVIGKEQAPESEEPVNVGLNELGPTPTEPSFEQKAIVAGIREAINVEMDAAATVKHFLNWLEGIGNYMSTKHPLLTKALGLLLTADGLMRWNAGNEVADMFYVRSNTGANLGFVGQRKLARDKWRALLFDVIGTDWTTPEVQAALALAQSDVPTASLKQGKARDIRLFLERFHEEYIDPANKSGKSNT